MNEDLTVEIVFAAPESQLLLELRLPPGTTVAEAIDASRLQERFPDYSFGELPVGVWGRIVSPAHELQPGDRVEIYRELEIDPMAARRVRASAPVPDPSEPH
jgi:putative ubiquitin-RnfH superfamily antitoxin RatB of RatAB toxin-antitoxin module